MVVRQNATTSYEEPFMIARKFASLDHLSGGRAGWNLVTTQYVEDAKNFGRDELISSRELVRPVVLAGDPGEVRAMVTFDLVLDRL